MKNNSFFNLKYQHTSVPTITIYTVNSRINNYSHC